MKARSNGFTLIEVIVVVGILVVIVTVGTNLLVNVIRGSNKAAVLNRTRQNANAAMDAIERDVRASVGLPPAEADCAAGCNYSTISLLTPGGDSALRYALCMDYDPAAGDYTGCRSRCPAGPCVGHVRKFTCTTWDANKWQFIESSCIDAGTLTNTVLGSGIEIDAKNSIFSVQTGASTVIRPHFVFRSPAGALAGKGFALSEPVSFESTFVMRND